MNHDDPPASPEPLPDALRDAIAAHHAPPPPPRDAMWARIEAARATRPATPVIPLAAKARPRFRYAWPVGIAALVALGIGIGRWTACRGDACVVRPTLATAPTAAPPRDTTASDAAFRVAAAQHVAQVETFLTLFRASAHADHLDTLVVPTARELLASNRMLSDSRAADDPRMKALLDELELVLAQIADLEHHRDRGDLNVITSDLEHRGVLPRLRAVVPAGGATAFATGET
jgi:hypothetical protein